MSSTFIWVWRPAHTSLAHFDISKTIKSQNELPDPKRINPDGLRALLGPTKKSII
jgi:hypothetical protein